MATARVMAVVPVMSPAAAMTPARVAVATTAVGEGPEGSSGSAADEPIVVVNLSGRGDKDMNTVARALALSLPLEPPPAGRAS